MTITKDIRYIGVNDHQVDLFEGQYIVPNGMAYNSYVILDEKIAVMDTVDAAFTHEWLDNLQNALGSRKPDYLVVQHMEPDHSANIVSFIKAYPDARIVSSAKAGLILTLYYYQRSLHTVFNLDKHYVCMYICMFGHVQLCNFIDSSVHGIS